MSIEIWKENKRIRPCPVSGAGVQATLEAAREDLAQSSVEGLGAPWRLAIAYEAARKFAAAALAAIGYRVPSGAGHHYYTIQSLRYTAGVDPATVRLLDAFREKRHDITYDNFAPPGEGEAAEMGELAEKIGDEIVRWLRCEHPELLVRPS